MSGYFEFSKSNNAIAAEHAGRYPATKLAQILGVKVGAIKALMNPCEWHHSSKHFNHVDYYSQETAEEIIEELQAWKPEKKDETQLENVRGSFLQWSGTRNHPKAQRIEFGPVRATKKGKWFILHLPNGDIRKNEDTRGLHLFHNGQKLTFNRD